jgi:serine/threonine protein phosphatase PrpC
VGDSRIYLIRDQKVFIRTRDHSAVGLLVQQGLLKDADVHTHPMRNFVEQCLGGDPEIPQITITDPKPLMAGDVMLLCSDGFWAPLKEDHLAKELNSHLDLQDILDVLARDAEETAAPSSDNVTAVALRWMD